MFFASDNQGPVPEAVLEALRVANQGYTTTKKMKTTNLNLMEAANSSRSKKTVFFQRRRSKVSKPAFLSRLFFAPTELVSLHIYNFR